MAITTITITTSDNGNNDRQYQQKNGDDKRNFNTNSRLQELTTHFFATVKLSHAMTAFASNSRSCSNVIIIVDDYNGNNNNNKDDDPDDGTMRPDITHRTHRIKFAWTSTQMYCCTVARTIRNAR